MMNPLLTPTKAPPCEVCGREACEGTHAFNADAREHRHQRQYVFPDGVQLGTVIDAIAAAGLAGNYVLADELKIRYAIDVCTRCARRHVRATQKPPASLIEYGIDAWGTICAFCELDLLATGRQKRHL